MTVPQFFGCAMVVFGPPLAMFCLTIARDPLRIIIMICSAFAWLVSFLAASICWAILNSWGEYLAVGAVMSVLMQELFRYMFHIIVMKAHAQLTLIMNKSDEAGGIANPNHVEVDHAAASHQQSSGVQDSKPNTTPASAYRQIRDRLIISYASGLGYGTMSGLFAFVNVLVDSLGPATTGLHGDSQYFFIVSAITTLAFILMNVSWSILTADSIECSDHRLLAFVVGTHLLATALTFLNRLQYQIISLISVNIITIICGVTSYKVAIKRLSKTDRSQ